ncbi:MAG: hypothetical protein ACM3N3_17605 [Betaproteobacteria bacterium]|jgi:ABC-type uncharacterized transport system permease subunit|nr:hypothetical protein [Candidatus Binatia bacterium]
MKPFVRYTALFLAIVFLSGAAFVWFDVFTHDNVFTNPELKIAAGWLTTGLMLLGLSVRGWRGRKRNATPSSESLRSPQ